MFRLWSIKLRALHLRLWDDDRLYEHEGYPDVFFAFKGEAKRVLQLKRG